MLVTLENIIRTYGVSAKVAERLEALEAEFSWGVPDYMLTPDQLDAKYERQELVRAILDGEEV